MRIVIDLDPTLYESIRKSLSRYGDIQKFIEISVQNQLHLEERDLSQVEVTSSTISNLPPIDATFANLGQSLELKNITTVSPVLIERINSQHMPFCTRIFPLKLMLRYLANILVDEEWTNLIEFQDKCSRQAEVVGRYLSELDSRNGRKLRIGGALSAGLPIGRRSNTANGIVNSRKFYSNHIIGNVPNSTVRGMAQVLGYSMVRLDEKIGITKEGIDFALLKNPILDQRDENDNSSLSEEEIASYLKHVEDRLPLEWKLMNNVVESIDTGNNEHATLTADKSIHSSLGDRHQISILSTVMSRMSELRVIKITRIGNKHQYEVIRRL